MTTEQAFQLIENLDLREPLRRYGPRWSTVVVSPNGEILEVIRYKEHPTPELAKQHILRHPEAANFTAWPGRFGSISELVQEVELSAKFRREY